MDYPIIFINCSLFRFIAAIMAGKKLYETRTRNTLKSYIGKRVYLCETGRKNKLVSCTCIIDSVICITSMKQWQQYRKDCYIKKGSVFDYIPGTKKYLYRLTDIQKINPFIPKEGYRHGRIAMDYNGKIEQ